MVGKRLPIAQFHAYGVSARDHRCLLRNVVEVEADLHPAILKFEMREHVKLSKMMAAVDCGNAALDEWAIPKTRFGL